MGPTGLLNAKVLYGIQTFCLCIPTDIKISYRLLLSLHSIIAVSVYPSLINSWYQDSGAKRREIPLCYIPCLFCQMQFSVWWRKVFGDRKQKEICIFYPPFLFLQCLFGFVFTKGDLTQVTFTKYKKLGNTQILSKKEPIFRWRITI